MVADGTLPAGTRLATVRQMAADLGLAPNTVARAYRELEADGLDRHPRAARHVRAHDARPGPDLGRLVADFVSSARALGLTCPRAPRLRAGRRSRTQMAVGSHLTSGGGGLGR